MKNNQKKFNIVKAAQKRFARHGLAKTTIEEIARDLRIGKASIYHYYASKEDIYYDVISFEIDRFISEIGEILSNSQLNEPEKKLSAYLDFKSKTPGKYSLIFDLVKLAFREFPLERDTENLKNLLKNEESIIMEFLKDTMGKKKPAPALAGMIVRQTWTFVLSESFNRTITNEELLTGGLPPLPTTEEEAMFWETYFRQLIL
ncbi:MAG: TetR/AcrR family transcriptional regulator [Ignavibacteria bacterium]|jgi:AcrR family transcriptional regulator|nr:TetR/AcrR family transcriptional regulator [Ignavibacteria bacterium]MCU7504221.1 TetR/AcrR family transcriptional regulator [Ignavibacteria bacterium]MCU7516066.1 TetR/AcrR family transcriptional regulator [Ignavibacteria bacterium]